MVGGSGYWSPSASAKPNSFTGAAPGSVRCTLSVAVSFSPRLIKSGGGTNPSLVTGHVSSCATSNSAVTIKGGVVTGSFSQGPFSCTPLASVSAPATLDIAWKGTVKGSVSGTTYTGKASFSPSTVSYGGGAPGLNGFSMPGNLKTSDVTGSFAGLSTATATVLTDLPKLHSICRHRGIRSLTMSGTITVGTTTVVVGPADLVNSNPSQGQFVSINQSSGLGGVGMVYGPGTPPRGVGSLQLDVTNTTDHWSVYNYDHIGTKLSDITMLGYSTHTDNATTDPVLQLEINPGNTSGVDAGVTYSTLSFEPYLQAPGVTPNVWQSWNVLVGKVWGTHLTGAPNSAPLTWDAFLSTYPNATIKGGFGVDVGSGWSTMTGDADALSIGTTEAILYDFEPVGPTLPSSLQVTTSSLPSGVPRGLYSATLAASGGNPPYQWSVSSLPPGLHLKGKGVIVGRFFASDSGTYSFTVKVVDHRTKKRTHNTASKLLSITVS